MTIKISRRSFRHQLGATMIEYAVIICLIALVGVIGVGSVGKQLAQPCPGDANKVKANVGYGRILWYMSHAGDAGEGDCTDGGGDHGD